MARLAFTALVTLLPLPAMSNTLLGGLGHELLEVRKAEAEIFAQTNVRESWVRTRQGVFVDPGLRYAQKPGHFLHVEQHVEVCALFVHSDTHIRLLSKASGSATAACPPALQFYKFLGFGPCQAFQPATRDAPEVDSATCVRRAAPRGTTTADEPPAPQPAQPGIEAGAEVPAVPARMSSQSGDLGT